MAAVYVVGSKVKILIYFMLDYIKNNASGISLFMVTIILLLVIRHKLQ